MVHWLTLDPGKEVRSPPLISTTGQSWDYPPLVPLWPFSNYILFLLDCSCAALCCCCVLDACFWEARKIFITPVLVLYLICLYELVWGTPVLLAQLIVYVGFMELAGHFVGPPWMCHRANYSSDWSGWWEFVSFAFNQKTEIVFDLFHHPSSKTNSSLSYVESTRVEWWILHWAYRLMNSKTHLETSTGCEV